MRQPLEQLFAVGGQPHPPRGAVQQAHAQLRFQLLHGGGHRGARHLQHMGCADKAAHLRHLHEYAVLIESVHRCARYCPYYCRLKHSAALSGKPSLLQEGLLLRGSIAQQQLIAMWETTETADDIAVSLGVRAFSRPQLSV